MVNKSWDVSVISKYQNTPDSNQLSPGKLKIKKAVRMEDSPQSKGRESPRRSPGRSSTYSNNRLATMMDSKNRPKLKTGMTMALNLYDDSPFKGSALRHCSEDSLEDESDEPPRDPIEVFQEEHEANRPKYLLSQDGIIDMLDSQIEIQKNEKEF